jgi:hypothetical protein
MGHGAREQIRERSSEGEDGLSTLFHINALKIYFGMYNSPQVTTAFLFF